MRIYLLNPPFVPNFGRCGRWQGVTARSGGLDYPKLLAYTTGLLETEFGEVRLIDAIAQGWDRKIVLEDVKKFGPELIIIDSNFSSLSNDLEVARLLKEVTGAITVMVGPPTSQFPERILRSNGVDAVARLEYDFTIKEIAGAVEKGRDFKEIKGISYKEDNRIIHNSDREFTTSEDLDRMPFVSIVYKRHLDIKRYFLSQSLYPELQIFAGRGCPHQCTFCSWPKTLTGRKYRLRSVQNVVDELEYIREELPEVKEAFLEDDTFTIDQRKIREFCEEVQRRGLNIVWSCNARANLEYDTLRKMKEVGCRLLIVGYESGEDKILEEIKKDITIEQMKRFTREAKKTGLMIQGDFIIGLPGETEETAQKTIEFIKKLKPNILQVAIATPIPGTEFYQWAKDNGFLLTENMGEAIDEQGYQKCVISYPHFPAAEIERYVDKALREYYLSPSYIQVALNNILRRNGIRELRVMLRSAGQFFRYLRRGTT